MGINRTEYNKIIQKLELKELYELNKMIVDEINFRKSKISQEARSDLHLGDRVMINDTASLTSKGSKYRDKVFTIVKFARKNIHIRAIDEYGRQLTFSIDPCNVHKVKE